MNRTFYNISIFLLVACSCHLISLPSTAQTENVQPKFKQVFVYIPKAKVAARVPKKNNSEIIDSLKKELQQSDSIYQTQLFQSNKKDSIIDLSNQKILKQQPILAALQSEISKYEALNIQTKKNNFILFVFNSIVCVLLFLMLARYLLIWRKKKKLSSQKLIVVSPEETPGSNVSEEQNKMTFNLEQLEKLGSLRNAGILTEEEFVIQKKKILGN